jgi:hypothetical protein
MFQLRELGEGEVRKTWRPDARGSSVSRQRA